MPKSLNPSPSGKKSLQLSQEKALAHKRSEIMKTKPRRQLLTVEETSSRLALKVSTIGRMILLRKISYVKFGRTMRKSIKEVEKTVREDIG